MTGPPVNSGNGGRFPQFYPASHFTSGSQPGASRGVFLKFMKVVRFLVFGVAAFLALLVVVVGVAFTSAFQTWLARRELAAQPGLTATLGRVSAGLDHVRLEQLHVTQSGATLVIPSLDADLSLVSAAGRSVQIKKLVAKGWTVDLTSPAAGEASGGPGSGHDLPPASSGIPGASGPAAAPAQAAAAVFQGVFNQLRLPVDLAVDSVELEGEIIFPVTAGQPPGRARVTLTGGQLGAGHEGRFNFTATTALAPTAQVNALNATGSLLMAMDTPRTFSRLGVNLEAEARGPQFPQGTKLSAALTAGHSNAGESYTVVVEAAGRKLLTIQADYPADSGRATGGRSIKGAWMVDTNDGDVMPFALGRPLPAFAAKGEGVFETDAALAGYSASGRFTLTADKLGVVRPELEPVGAIKGALAFDLMHEGDTVRVTSLSLDLAGARPVLTARSLQPFVYNVKTRLSEAADPAKDLLSLELQGLPLAWVQPFAAGVVLTGNDLRGSFVVGVRNDGVAGLRPTAPLTLGNLSVARAGKPLIRAVDLSLKLSADYTSQGWQAELSEVTARSGGVTLLTLEAKAGQLAGKDQAIKTTGQWTASLPGLLTQPVAGGIFALTGGRAAGDFSASLGVTKEISAKLAFTGLTVDPKISAASLPAISADVRADIAKDGKIVLKAPVLLQRDGRKSDLTLDGTLTTATAGVAVSGRITSTYLAVDDAQVLASALAAPPAAAVPATPVSPAGPDSLPFWTGVTGDVSLALKKVSYQQSLEITDVVGTLHLEAGALKLDGVRAGLGEGSDFKLAGGVTFDGKVKEPYALKADFAVNNFDSAALFKALNPGKPPTIEGRFNVTSKLTGGGANADQLFARTRGDFQLSSKGGTCRLLQADLSDKIQKTQSTVATLGGLLAAATGRDKIADYANRTQIVVEVANDWKEIPFDQLNVTVSRDNDLNVMLQDFTLISPTKRIAGTGEIRHVEGTPLLSQALDLRLQLWAQGKTADLMKRASLLTGQQDNLGYTAFLTPIRIIGTLENPDTSEFRNALLKAAGSSLLNNLLGR